MMQKKLACRLFGTKQTKRLQQQVRMQSCVQEALQLAKIGGVNAMHDATEGGLVAALNEMAEASEVGFKVEIDKIPITAEVRMLQKHFRLSNEQVLAMSSAGTIVAAVNAQAKSKVQETLRKIGISSSFVGNFTESKGRILMKNGESLNFPQVADDPYSKILSPQV
jgi:hydrogenase maturation factor